MFCRLPMNIHHLELFYSPWHVTGGIMPAVRNIPYGIQQPAVSGVYLQLEGDLGIKLFNRRPFELTPAGQELYEFIRPFFGTVETGRRKTARRGSPIHPPGRAGIALRDHLPEVLRYVRSSFPQRR